MGTIGINQYLCSNSSIYFTHPRKQSDNIYTVDLSFVKLKHGFFAYLASVNNRQKRSNFFITCTNDTNFHDYTSKFKYV